MQNLSVITVCVPYIKNFLLGLESGMIRTGDFHLGKVSNTSTPESGSLPFPGARRQHQLNLFTQQDDILTPSETPELNEATHSNVITGNAYESVVAHSPENTSWDSESQSSRRKMIKKTTEWTVDFNAQTDVM